MNRLARGNAFIPGLLRISLLGLLLAMAWPSSATATSACVGGSLSTLANTTCDIGSLQFTFGSLSGSFSTQPFGGQTSVINQWSDSNFTLTPVTNGFALSFLGGAQSITGATNTNATDMAFLPFTVSVLDPTTQQLTSMSISGGSLSASGPYASNAQYYMVGVNVPGSAFNFVSDVQGSFNSLSTPTFDFPTNSFGITFLQSGQFQAIPFSLFAANGSTAGWDGTNTTFTFNAASIPQTPEPGSVLLFGTGLAAMFGAARRKWLK